MSEYWQRALSDHKNLHNKSLTVRKLLEKNFLNVYDNIRNIEAKILSCVSDFNNAIEKNFLLLSPYASKSRKIIDKIKFSSGKQLVRERCALIAKYNETFLPWRNNACVFYGDIIFKPINNGLDAHIYFSLTNVEFFDFYQKNAFTTNHREMELKYPSEPLSTSDSLDFLKIIFDNDSQNIKNELNFFNDNDSKIRLNKWRWFVKSMRAYLDDRWNKFLHLWNYDADSKSCKVICFGESDTDYIKDIEQKDCYINDLDDERKWICNIKIRKEYKYFEILENESSTLNKEKNELSFKVNELEEDIELNKNNQFNLNSDLAPLKVLKTKILTEIDKLEDRVSKIIHSIKQNNVRIGKLEDTIKKLKKNQKEQNIALINEKSDEIIRLKNENNPFLIKLSSLKNELADLNHENNDIQVKINLKNNEIKTLLERFNYLLSKKSNWQKDLKSKQVKLSCIKNEIKFLRDANVKILVADVKLNDGEDDVNFYSNFTEYLYMHYDFDKKEFAIQLDWTLSHHDQGLNSIFKRYDIALRTCIEGWYKNPYLSLALNSPSKINFLGDLDLNINLNDEQYKAVQKAFYCNDIAYIQGPPGTGKTQTIAALASLIVNDNKKLVVSSYTNVAIDNFFDRLYASNKRNPNLFLLRYIRHLNPNLTNDYGEDRLIKHFLSAIDNNIVFTDDSANLIIEEILSINFDGWNKNQYYSNKILDLLNNFDANSFKELCESNNEFRYFLENSVKHAPTSISNWNDYREDIYDAINGRIGRIIRSGDSNNIYQYFEKWNSIINKAIDLLGNKLKLEDILSKENLIKRLNNQLVQSEFAKKYNIFLKHEANIDSAVDEGVQFKNILYEYNLINVVGMTTNSKKNFEFNDNVIDLYSEYNADYIIIDEVSKSITPEIISNAVLAKKVILVGDYRQLPPVMDFSNSFIKNYYENRNGSNDKFFTDYLSVNTPIANSSISSSSDSSIQLYKLVDAMYSESLFKSQIDNIKKGGTNHSYQWLNQQYRFTKKIMDVVNLSYLDEEKLILGGDISFDKININVSGELNDSSLIVIDTSVVSDNFTELIGDNLNRIIKNNQYKAFDQKNVSLLDYRDYKLLWSRYNEYNAFVIYKCLVNLLANNSKLKANPSDIGVIAMTRSQVMVIKWLLRKNNVKKGIVVDTVDNFQGKEKNVILLDMVRAKGDFNDNGLYIPDRRNVEFYKKIERLNVAMSRAQSKLIIVGAFNNFLNDIPSKIDGETVMYLKNIYDIASNQADLYYYNECEI